MEIRNLKKWNELVLGTLLILVIIFCDIGFIRDLFLFIVFSIITLLCLFAGAIFIAQNLILKLLNPNVRKIYEGHKIRFRITILAYFLFFFLASWIINIYSLPKAFHIVRLLGYAGTLFFTIFLGWTIIRPNKKRKLFVISRTIVFILFIFSLTVVTFYTSKNIELSSTKTLKSSPYLTRIPQEEESIQYSGVTKYDQLRACKGINIYNLGNLSTAYLMDMSGNILHKWSAKIKKDDSWDHIAMLRNGDLLAIVPNEMLIKVDWNSEVKWIKEMRFHHDFALSENHLYALVRKDDLVFKFGLPVPISNDYIVVLPLGSGRATKKEISLYKIFKKEIPFNRFVRIYLEILSPERFIKIVKQKLKGDFLFLENSPFEQSPFEILHANSIEIINRDIPGLCKKGDVLVSIGYLNLIAILNIEKEEIIWKWREKELSMQQHLSLLGNGNILIFDNGVNRKYSRVIELNPITRKIVWQYKSNPETKFFSNTRGGIQKLSNGNILITDSDSGYVFEVTNKGETVWEFYNPEIDEKEKKRAAIYQLMRFTHPEDHPILKDLKR